jgi:hypothetical protein
MLLHSSRSIAGERLLQFIGSLKQAAMFPIDLRRENPRQRPGC